MRFWLYVATEECFPGTEEYGEWNYLLDFLAPIL